jgi:glycosyltransferase 2 family protein
MASRTKRIVFAAVQVTITVGVLAWLLHDRQKRAQMAAALAQADQLWIIGGIAAYGAVEVVAGLRWDGLLRVQGIHLRPLRLLMLLLIGLFFNFFIPGGTGGDVVKVYYLIKEAPGKGAAAVLSVLVDRIIGLFALILLATGFIALRWSWLTATRETAGFVWSALIIMAVSVGAVGFSYVLTSFGLVHRLPVRFPGRDRLAELALAYNLYGRAWRASLVAIGASFISHLGYFFTFYCAARAFAAPGVRVPDFGQLCAIMPVINTITSLPISVGGLGVREGLFQVFLHQLAGVDEGVAVLISSMGYLMTAFWGGVGGLLYLFYRPTEHARLTEIDREVAELEHHVAEDEIAMEISEEKAER